MASIDPQIIHRWIKQRIMFEQATITYRDLVRETSCEADRARELLEGFRETEDGKRLKVQPTYLMFGQNKISTGDCTRSMRVERAKCFELEDFKSKFDSISCVQIYSISGTQTCDLSLLKLSKPEQINLRQQNPTKSYNKESSIEPKTAEESSISAADGKPKRENSEATEPKVGQTDSKAPSTNLEESGQLPSRRPSDNTKYKVTADLKSVMKSHSSQKLESQETKSTVPAKRRGSGLDDRKMNADDRETDQPEGLETDRKKAKQTPEATERKRVTKTRIVKKKKIVRLKDKKGYRVNREEIEEVEETYTDWESPEPTPSLSPTQPSAANKEKSQPDKKKDEQLSASLTSSKSETDGQGNSQKSLSAKNDNPDRPKKKKSTSSSSKEQSNITSFFKKSST